MNLRFVFSSSLTVALATDVDQPEVTKSVVNHVQTSLARQCYNLGMTQPLILGAYQAAALSVRDDLLVILCVSGAYIHLSPLHIGQLERYSAELYP